MHQTTVRFGADLWEALEEECARLGVSAAQYLREAALTRLVYAASKRGDQEFELALDLATGRQPMPEHERDEGLERVVAPAQGAESAYQRAVREGSEAAALAAQGQLARQRARLLRERSASRRSR